MHIYAIGDIHGHLSLLEQAHDLIATDMARHGAAPVIHLGDLVDRGPDSRGVIDFLLAGEARGEDWVVLKGNHDRMFSMFLEDARAQDEGLKPEYTWLHPRLGGATTLASYGIHAPGDRPVAPVWAEAQEAVPQAHRSWLAGRPTWHARDQALFVHAGSRPGIAPADQRETDLVWIREPFLSDPRDHGALVVHGHTALDAPTHYGNRLNLDSGAAYGGPLTAAVIEGRQAFHLTPQGRLPILPA
ncbi:MAG TPA: serine/threonine protein phosphatase [Gemmobacter sp.]|nr:serine/threonine protein phosphatase [Gemmobacter sp.]